MSDASDQLLEYMTEAAGQAKDVTVDGQRVIRRGLNELADFHRYLAGQEAKSRGNGLGVMFTKLIPPSGGG